MRPSSSSHAVVREELSEECRRRFHDGDVDALAEVYDRYARPVWTVAVSVTRCDHLAQEAVQETFLRAWRVAGVYDPGLALGPWLMTIARRASLDLLRREFRPTRGGHEAEQDVVVEDPGMDRVWTAWQVQEALAQLREDERAIVRLSFFDDLTQTQIAERLGLPLGTVKSRSYRAHRRLAELLCHLREDAPGLPAHIGNRSGSSRRTGSAEPSIGRGEDRDHGAARGWVR